MNNIDGAGVVKDNRIYAFVRGITIEYALYCWIIVLISSHVDCYIESNIAEVKSLQENIKTESAYEFYIL